MTIELFPFADYWWFYLVFSGFVLLLLKIDLGFFHKAARVISFREALGWSVIWVTLALLFNYFLYQSALWNFSRDSTLLKIPGFDPSKAAGQVALEFLTGYLIEKTLSLDNIFVFVVVFAYFGIPFKHQHRVLFYGIWGALILRGVFISIGTVLMQYHWIVWIFGALLILTGIKMLLTSSQKAERPGSFLVPLIQRVLPVTTELQGQSFFIRKNGTLWATPLLLALVVLEASDVLFAIDSVPAIFAITREPLIVFTSNIFAILGLRAMFFMLAGAMDRFYLLKYGVASVLVFVGLKMLWLNNWFGGKFPIVLSLGIILGILTLSLLCSIFWLRQRGPNMA